MNERYAILLDGGFVLHKLGPAAGAAEVEKECERIKQDPLLAGMKLLRIYYYDAKPATETITNPIDGVKENLANSKTHARMTKLHSQLALQRDVALRLGELDVAPKWTVREKVLADHAKTGRPILPREVRQSIVQKGVDLRIGLDMARLALRQFVTTIVVVTGDSDLIPAFKFVRREGLRVYLDFMGHGVKVGLKEHCDAILQTSPPGQAAASP